MGLETTASLSTIAGFHTDWPSDADPFSECDDHYSNIKLALYRTFPNVNAEVSADVAELNHLRSCTSLVQTQLTGLVTNRQTMSESVNATIQVLSATISTRVDTMSNSVTVQTQALSATLNASKHDYSATQSAVQYWGEAEQYTQSNTPAAETGAIWFQL